MNKQLYRSHRVFGYEVARARTEEGTELVVLQTAPHKHEVSPAHMLMPVGEKEAAFEARIRLIEAIERARSLGVDSDELRQAFEDALQSGGTH
jgi:hypothetical protein